MTSFLRITFLYLIQEPTRLFFSETVKVRVDRKKNSLQGPWNRSLSCAVALTTELPSRAFLCPSCWSSSFYNSPGGFSIPGPRLDYFFLLGLLFWLNFVRFLLLKKSLEICGFVHSSFLFSQTENYRVFLSLKLSC